ncbi:MAG: D-aminoacylase [Gammaproteobacteria bacterium]|nr:D-aminoacylase [Gammaproteobacteria bacterium]MDH3751715.1 D-aminoacylase [Gammaproteobacteria bacterium]MDH3804267.1 D-aminoacylase [Gammaproteobacteria bacterium]
MRWSSYLALAGLLVACTEQPDAVQQTLDVVIGGGTVYSGVDEDPVIADVGIVGDRIVAVGNLRDHPADLRLDVTGLAVSPGFIDIHSHALRPNESRSGIYLWPDAENLIRQGVTSVIGGPDGWSPLPIEDDFTKLEANPAAVNFGTFVGHGTIRELVMGFEDRPASDEELQQMRDEVEKAMRSGAFGLSSGLLYAPGRFAPAEEVIELAKVVAPYGGIYISHMRNEALRVLESIEETIRIGEEAGIPAQITHHKVMGAPMWGSSTKTLAHVDAAIARGVDVSSDQYPYPASSTGLPAVFPRWSLAGGSDALKARLDDPEQRAKVKEGIVYAMINERGGNDPSKVALANCSWDPSLNGLSLADVLRQREIEVNIDNAAELIMDLQYAGGCICVYHAMSIDDVERIMQHPKTMIASDGGIMAPGNLRPHPRYYGTNAKVLGHYVRERGILSLSTAIHKMTRMPADRINLADRGRIEVGAMADIAVFDPAAIIDKATFEDPHQYAEGVHHVLVNGQAVLLNKEMTGTRPGRVLRSPAARPAT